MDVSSLTRWTSLGAVAWMGCAATPRIVSAPHRPVVAVVPMAEGDENDWPMYRDDPERSGFAEGSTVGASVDVLWRIPAFNTTAYGAAKGSPSVVGDMLYCGTDTGRFVAARVTDGTTVWETQFRGTTHGIHGSPAIVGGTVYIGAYDGTDYAFDRFTGRPLWRYHDGDQIGSSPAVVARWATVFSAHEIVPQGGFVVALDARTGEPRWRQETIAHPHSSVAVDVQRALVFVGDNSGRMYAWGAHDGRPVWTHVLTEGTALSIKTTPTVAASEGLLLFGAWTGRVYALDEWTGEVRWTHETGGHIMGSTAYDPGTGMLYVGTPRGWIHALDVHTGAERWTFQIGAAVVSSPAVSGDGRAVVVGANNGRVYALRADTGALMWWVPVGGQVSGSPTLVGNRIYVTTGHGDLTALHTGD